MGLLAYIYRNSHLRDCTNGGFSSRVKTVCIINADGPFEPSDDCPAVILESGYNGPLTNDCVRAVSIDDKESGSWLMCGGNFLYTSDERFASLIKELTGVKYSAPVSIHDRKE